MSEIPHEIMFVEQSETPEGRPDTLTVLVRTFDSADLLKRNLTGYVVYQKPSGSTRLKRTITASYICTKVGGGFSLTGKNEMLDTAKLDRPTVGPSNLVRHVMAPAKFRLEFEDDGHYAILHDRDDSLDPELALLAAIEAYRRTPSLDSDLLVMELAQEFEQKLRLVFSGL